jgi:hypothetical protein
VRAILFFFALSLVMAQTPAGQPAHEPQLPGVRNVYFLPLPNGLEQFVANHLVKRGVLSVVTDPQSADAVFTDTVGLGFQEKMEELYPAPAPVKTEESGEDGKKAKADEAGPETKDSGAGRIRSSVRGKGTIFLVDRKTSVVLWSAYVRPKSTSPRDLDRAAKEIVERIADSIKGGSGISH